ncbi:MAG: class II aldolase and adducin N-terminal domain-containing protein [Pseudomonadota bacterium]
MDAARIPNIEFWQERVDLAAAFRWTERYDMHEAVANHFSLAVNDTGTQFLINPNRAHFSQIRASDLLLLDANDPDTLSRPNAPDETAWGLHSALHRRLPHARCAMHVHSVYATVLASLADARLPPIDQNSAMFFGHRQVVDTDYGGLAFEEEGDRCAALFEDGQAIVMTMGNHGILVIGDSVHQAFNRMYFFERAARTYIMALQTGKPLKVLSDEIAEKTAQEIDVYPEQGQDHLAALKQILDQESSNYAT